MTQKVSPTPCTPGRTVRSSRFGLVSSGKPAPLARRLGSSLEFSASQDATPLTFAASAPHTPWSMRLRSAYSRQRSCTGQPSHTRLAASTPTPSEGKKVSGCWVAQFPRAIQLVSIRISLVRPMSNRPLCKEYYVQIRWKVCSKTSSLCAPSFRNSGHRDRISTTISGENGGRGRKSRADSPLHSVT